jgi:hypothetical protein
MFMNREICLDLRKNNDTSKNALRWISMYRRSTLNMNALDMWIVFKLPWNVIFNLEWSITFAIYHQLNQAYFPKLSIHRAFIKPFVNVSYIALQAKSKNGSEENWTLPNTTCLHNRITFIKTVSSPHSQGNMTGPAPRTSYYVSHLLVWSVNYAFIIAKYNLIACLQPTI